MKRRITLLASILALGSIGCAHVRRKLVLPDVPQTGAAKPLPEVKIEAPPEIETPVLRVEIPWPKPNPAEDPSVPKQVPARKPPATAPAAQMASPEVPAPATPIVPAVPTRRLGEILTDARRREYEAEFSGSMTRARAAVKRASGRGLTAAQKETVGRIYIFLQQAEASRAKDLATALQLARRADLLGQDLLKSLR